MRWLTLSLAALGCAQPTVSAFDQTCGVPEDCAAVLAGSDCHSSCGGHWATIRADEQPRWDRATGDWRRTQCIGASQLLIFCPLGEPMLDCVAGACTVTDVTFE